MSKAYEIFRNACKARNMTVYSVARKTNLSNGMFDYWRNGGEPRLSNLIAIADVLGIPVEMFVDAMKEEAHGKISE